MTEQIIAGAISVLSVIALLGIGIHIGREHGTLEKFFISVLQAIEERLSGKH